MPFIGLCVGSLNIFFGSQGKKKLDALKFTTCVAMKMFLVILGEAVGCFETLILEYLMPGSCECFPLVVTSCSCLPCFLTECFSPTKDDLQLNIVLSYLLIDRVLVLTN